MPCQKMKRWIYKYHCHSSLILILLLILIVTLPTRCPTPRVLIGCVSVLSWFFSNVFTSKTWLLLRAHPWQVCLPPSSFLPSFLGPTARIMTLDSMTRRFLWCNFFATSGASLWAWTNRNILQRCWTSSAERSTGTFKNEMKELQKIKSVFGAKVEEVERYQRAWKLRGNLAARQWFTRRHPTLCLLLNICSYFTTCLFFLLHCTVHFGIEPRTDLYCFGLQRWWF